MSSNRPPALKTKAYVEVDIDLLRSTGEIRITGEPIIAPTITEKVPRGKFEIVYMAELLDLMQKLGNKKIKVLQYLLEKKDGYNQINATNVRIAKETNVSRQTVVDTLKILKDANLARRDGTVLMLSPNLAVKGNVSREAYLMRRYEELPADGKEILDADINPQFMFGEDAEGNLGVIQEAEVKQ